VAEAPDVFELDESELKAHLIEERPGSGQRSAVESAARHCPTRAIEIRQE
jgi:ferredoxin